MTTVFRVASLRDIKLSWNISHCIYGKQVSAVGGEKELRLDLSSSNELFFFKARYTTFVVETLNNVVYERQPMKIA